MLLNMQTDTFVHETQDLCVTLLTEWNKSQHSMC